MLSKSTWALFVFAFVLLSGTNAWWLVGKNGNSNQCPSRGGANPYYFGTTSLWCMKGSSTNSGKRGTPLTGMWELSHRFIYYQGFYFELLSNSKAYIARHRQAERCPGKRESSPAVYSELSVHCIKGCAGTYKCKFGSYSALSNNCHKFCQSSFRSPLYQWTILPFLVSW